MGCEFSFDLAKLRNLIENELCEQNGLLVEAFPMTERVLYKQNSPCGVFFCLHGPRSVRLTAVLDLQSYRVLFYDSSGQRTNTFEVEPAAIAIAC